jgi:hypothetical protein
LSILFGLFSLAAVNLAEDASRVEFCANVTFRETPFADMRCALELPEDALGDRKYFKFVHDSDGRLIEVSFRQNDELRAHAGRFVRAPQTRISYLPGLEVRQYFDEHGNRTLVSGEVYETRFRLNDDGKRIEAWFMGFDGEPLEDHFGIARYVWTVDRFDVVTEWRYNLAGDVVRNRPGFGYMVTRFHYDLDGLLTRMENLGANGDALTPDASGTVATEIGYNEHSQFQLWRNLGMDGQSRRGMSALAEIRYDPGLYYSEAQADFIDADGTPQTTRWGAHRVSFDFDRFGNVVLRRFFDVNGDFTDVEFGVAETRYEWSDDGSVQLEEAFFNVAGEPVNRINNGVHAYQSQTDSAGRVTEIRSVDAAGRLVIDDNTGFAVERTRFDTAGRRTATFYVDGDGDPVDHAVWGYAQVIYHYDNTALSDAIFRNADGDRVDARWNPDH